MPGPELQSPAVTSVNTKIHSPAFAPVAARRRQSNGLASSSASDPGLRHASQLLMASTNSTGRSLTGDWLTERTSFTLESFSDRFMWEDGRRYHAYREGRYHLPNDEMEQQREELMHILVEDILGGNLFLSPVSESPRKVMDLACGLGLWSIEMGDRYPDAEIVGIDLSPIQPTSVPPNVSFQVDDIEDTWVHDHDYDFIHMREAVAYMRQGAKVIESAFEHLKPGGWFEIQEFDWKTTDEDGTIDPQNPVNIYLNMMREAGRAAGGEGGLFEPRIDNMGEVIEKAGFVDVRKTAVRVPWGIWPPDEKMQRRGACLAMAAEPLLSTTATQLSSIGLKADTIEPLYASISNMFRDPNMRTYATYYTWCGRKPES